MPTYKGKAVKIYEKNGIYSIKGEDGNYYGCYKTNPGGIEGKTVSFDYVDKGNFKNADTKTIKVVQDDVSGTVPNTVSSYPSSRDAAELMKQQCIAFQNARGVAVNYLELAFKAGAVPLPAKKSDMLGALDGLLAAYTAKFFNENMEVYATGKLSDSSVVDAVAGAPDEEDFS